MGFAFDLEFKPILLPNETALLMGSQFPGDGQPVICIAVGALPEYIKDFGSLSADTWDTDNEDTNLELGGLHLGQFRVAVLDDIKVQLKNPAPVEQWRTARAYFYLRQFPTEPGYDWLSRVLFAMSEFYIWEDNTPRFDLYCEDGISTSRLLFRGWRFKIEKIAKDALTSRQIVWIDSWPAGK